MAEDFIKKYFQGDKDKFGLFAKGLDSKEELISKLEKRGITDEFVITEIVGAAKEFNHLPGTFSQFSQFSTHLA